MRHSSLREAVAKTAARKKATLATAKSLVKKYAKDLQTEIDSRSITIWMDTADSKVRNKAEKAAKAISKELGVPWGKYGTNKIIIYYKDQPADKGDWNDPSSRHHY